MASTREAVYAAPATRVLASELSAGHVSLSPASRHGVTSITGGFGGAAFGGAAFGAQAEGLAVIADVKPNRTGRLPRDRQLV